MDKTKEELQRLRTLEQKFSVRFMRELDNAPEKADEWVEDFLAAPAEIQLLAAGYALTLNNFACAVTKNAKFMRWAVDYRDVFMTEEQWNKKYEK